MQRAGLTQVELARRAGCAPRTVAGYLSGEVEPPPARRDALAAIVRFPPSFFYGGAPQAPSHEGVSFRAKSAMTARQRDQAIGASALAMDFVEWAGRYVRLPASNVPRWRDLDPEAAAEAVRAEWGLGEAPIGDMIGLLERHGVRVFSLADDCRELDGYSFWHEGVAYVFLNTLTSGERGRMDAAHELGHLVMHFWGGELSSKLAEEQAKRFASAFLMPQRGFTGTARPDFDVAQIVRRKHDWNVSAFAYARRLADLGFLSEWQVRLIYQEMGSLGYRTREPESSPREASTIWRQLLVGLRARNISRAQIAAELGFPASELNSLLFGLVFAELEGGREPELSGDTQTHDLRLL